MINSMFHGEITFLLAVSGGVTCQLGELIHLMPWINQVIVMPYSHTGQCKRTGGCYNELVVAFYITGGGVKGKKIYTC